MPSSGEGPKNIILISIDDLRFDCIGCEEDKRALDRYGVDVEVDTPCIDRFASQGVRFSQAIAPASYTSASHASLLTGLYPPSHGVRAFFYTKLNEQVRTLAQILKDCGYRTFSSCDFHNMFDLLEITRGIDCRVNQDNAKILQILDQNRNDKMFLFMHFFDVHDPYGTSNYEIYPGYNHDVERDFEDLRLRSQIDAPSFLALTKEAWRRGYRGEVVSQYIKGVNKFDRGRFSWFIQGLRNLNLLDNSLVVITADHGEGDCGPTFSHGSDLSEEVIRVPLIFWCPERIPEGKVIDQQCSLVDVMPTILALANIRDQECDGTSLLPAIEKGESLSYPVYAERWANNITNEDMMSFMRECGESNTFCTPLFDVLLTHRSVRTPEYKLLVRGQPPSRQALADNEVLLKWTFQHVLNKHVDPEGFSYWLRRIDHEGINPEQLIETFVSFSEEKYQLFDLLEDPTEADNLLSDRRFLPNADRLMDVMHEIENRKSLCTQSHVKFDSDNEAALFEKQLRDLGYL